MDYYKLKKTAYVELKKIIKRNGTIKIFVLENWILESYGLSNKFLYEALMKLKKEGLILYYASDNKTISSLEDVDIIEWLSDEIPVKKEAEENPDDLISEFESKVSD